MDMPQTLDQHPWVRERNRFADKLLTGWQRKPAPFKIQWSRITDNRVRLDRVSTNDPFSDELAESLIVEEGSEATEFTLKTPLHQCGPLLTVDPEKLMDRLRAFTNFKHWQMRLMEIVAAHLPKGDAFRPDSKNPVYSGRPLGDARNPMLEPVLGGKVGWVSFGNRFTTGGDPYVQYALYLSEYSGDALRWIQSPNFWRANHEIQMNSPEFVWAADSNGGDGVGWGAGTPYLWNVLRGLGLAHGLLSRPMAEDAAKYKPMVQAMIRLLKELSAHLDVRVCDSLRSIDPKLITAHFRYTPDRVGHQQERECVIRIAGHDPLILRFTTKPHKASAFTMMRQITWANPVTVTRLPSPMTEVSPQMAGVGAVFELYVGNLPAYTHYGGLTRQLLILMRDALREAYTKREAAHRRKVFEARGKVLKREPTEPSPLEAALARMDDKMGFPRHVGSNVSDEVSLTDWLLHLRETAIMQVADVPSLNIDGVSHTTSEDGAERVEVEGADKEELRQRLRACLEHLEREARVDPERAKRERQYQAGCRYLKIMSKGLSHPRMMAYGLIRDNGGKACLYLGVAQENRTRTNMHLIPVDHLLGLPMWGRGYDWNRPVRPFRFTETARAIWKDGAWMLSGGAFEGEWFRPFTAF